MTSVGFGLRMHPSAEQLHGGLGVGLQYELVVVEVDNLKIFCNNISAKKQAMIEAPVL